MNPHMNRPFFVDHCRLFFLITQNCFAESIYPAAKVTVKAFDIKGNPLDGAEVTVRFYTPKGVGMGWGVNTKFVEGLTDKQGLFVAKSETTEDCGMTVSKEGFYFSSGKCNLEKTSILKRWEPWNPTIEVVLKEKRNPVPMYAKRTNVLKLPVLNQPLGYDLEIGDWVSPHGKGISNDLIFNFKTRYASRDDWECSCKITFSNAFDGIQEFQVSKSDRSEYQWPYEAPDKGYVPEKIWFDQYIRGKENNSLYDKFKGYILRVRTKTDEKGNIIAANYGKISGDIKLFPGGGVEFAYYYNPSGSKNLEYDPAKSLFKWKTINELNKNKVDVP